LKYIVIGIIFITVCFWMMSNDNKGNQPNRLTNDDVKSFISEMGTTKSKETIKLYATSWCGYCAKTRQFFKNNKLNYIEYNIEKDSTAYRRYNELNGQGVPLIETSDQVIRGYNEYKLNKLAADERYRL